jgi:electron transport complex protein RnfG
MIRSGILLALFAVAGTALVALTYINTKDDIAEAEREAMLKKLHEIIKPGEHNNDLFNDFVMVQSEEYLGTDKPLPVFRARKDGRPVAVLLTAVAPDGYSGRIKLLVGVRYDGTVAGVRVLSHQETPGLGDAIDERRSDWIFNFKGHSLQNPPEKDWKVQRDRGKFDQITGATITSRAVVKAVRKALEYYQRNKDLLFSKRSNSGEPDIQPQTETENDNGKRLQENRH